MKPTRETRKPISQLALADLGAFPIWEFATDEEGVNGQDETWVRPLPLEKIPRNAFSLSVAAVFNAAAGHTFKGMVGVNTFDGFEASHAAVITDDGHVFIPWPGYPGAPACCQSAARQIGLHQHQLFPLAYTLLVPLEGETAARSGSYNYVSGDGLTFNESR